MHSFVFLENFPDGSDQILSTSFQLCSMNHREAAEDSLATRCNDQTHTAPVFPVALFPNQTRCGETRGQLDRAVVAQVQSLRDRPHRGLDPFRKAFENKQELMLLGAQSFGAGRFLTEMQKCSNLVSEFGQRPKVIAGQVVGAHVQITSYHDVFSVQQKL
jgi:hypothetical protein